MTSVTFQYMTFITWNAELLPGSWFVDIMFRTSIKSTVFGVLESSYQLNLQSAGLALAKAIDPAKRLDVQTLASIIIGVAMSMVNLASTSSKMRALWKAVLRSTTFFSVERRRTRRALLLFVGIACLYTILISRAIFQTYMAIGCPYGLHNIGVGCVDPHGE